MCDNLMCELEECNVPRGDCHCGCGKKTNIIKYNCKFDGAIKGEPRLYYPKHSGKFRPDSYIINEETGCWEWQRAKCSDGYGSMWVEGKYKSAHKYYYELKYGPVPDELELDHVICQNRCCCNPDHMEPVTHCENTRRGHRAKLGIEDVEEIKILCASPGGLNPKDVAEIYGVHWSTIYKIMTNISWYDEKGGI